MGVPEDIVLKRLGEVDGNDDHPYYTILDLENLPLRNMRIFLKAKFPSQKRSNN